MTIYKKVHSVHKRLYTIKVSHDKEKRGNIYRR